MILPELGFEYTGLLDLRHQDGEAAAKGIYRRKHAAHGILNQRWQVIGRRVLLPGSEGQRSALEKLAAQPELHV